MEPRRSIQIHRVLRLIMLTLGVALWFQGSSIPNACSCWSQQLKPLADPQPVSMSQSSTETNPIFHPLTDQPSSTDSSSLAPSNSPSLPWEDQNRPSQIFQHLGNLHVPTNELDQAGETDAELVNFFDSIQVENFYEVAMSPYRIYRTRQNILDLVSYSDGDLGWASLKGTPYLKRDQSRGLTLGMSNHFLSGPEQVDLNPRLHELVLGYQVRTTLRDRLSLDLAATVGIYSDFKGSAREGWRLPGHAVAIFHASHRMDWVLGVDYLDRQDYRLLPVIGVSWHDFSLTSLRYDLVFPRPRIEFTLNDANRIYLQGNLGGGTWDVELADGTEDLMTYRDFRILLGNEKRFLDGSRRGMEVGYAFSRRLQLSESLVNLDFGNAVLFRLVSSF